MLILGEHRLLRVFLFRFLLTDCSAAGSIRLRAHFLKHLVDLGLILRVLHVTDSGIVRARHLLDRHSVLTFRRSLFFDD